MDNTDNLCPGENKEYNRRTTDYGNGKIEIAAYHSPRFRHMGSRRTSSGREAETSDEEREERTRHQVYAIRRKIKGYALSNSFHWFVTLTFNPEKIDSSDYETAKTTLLKWCRKMRDDYGQFSYLIIPEPHKSGAIHFHGLLGDIHADFVEAINPKTGEPLIRHERQVYNLTDWKYGFSDCEKIESPEKATSYITKYVTKDLMTDKKMYNNKRYFNSQGLAKPVIAYDMSDNTELDSFTPNFGIIETGTDGKNIINIGIYNLEKDKKTGALSQTDDSYFIAAKTESLPSAKYMEELSRQKKIDQQQYERFEKYAEEQRAKRQSKITAKMVHGCVELSQQEKLERKAELKKYTEEVFSRTYTEWQQIIRDDEKMNKTST